ncbi:hypothetical protein OBV_28490 [Oscillibacter valericigenes Sjm18-20]|nr:hypothetical protein OBV_28490 [Oscillibacter valericigenes Sjm18-20]
MELFSDAVQILPQTCRVNFRKQGIFAWKMNIARKSGYYKLYFCRKKCRNKSAI